MSDLLAVGHKRYAELARKLLALSGGDAMTELDPILALHLDLESPRPEWAMLRDELLCVGEIEAAAVAGQLGFVGLSNPAGSGIIAIIEGSLCYGFNANTEAVVWKNTGAAPAVTTGGPFNADQRNERVAGERIGALQMISGANAVLGGGAGQLVWKYPQQNVIGTLGAQDPWPIIMDPGKTITVWFNTANTLVKGSFHWRERAIERYEARR